MAHRLPTKFLSLKRVGRGNGGQVSRALGRSEWKLPHGIRGSSLQACLLEVLAGFRHDSRLAVELDDIVVDDEDAVLHPTLAQGKCPADASMPAQRPRRN
jgi:hypothetical protein